MGTNAKNDTSLFRGSLDAVVREYYSPLRSFFRKHTQNPAEVDDLVQQVFLRLAQHGDKDEVRHPNAYIFKTASNTLQDFKRREGVRARVIHQGLDQISEMDEVDADFSPERVLIGLEAMEIIASTLRRLPERTRDVFVLSCFEGMKYMDIARAQKISVRIVVKHMSRALTALSEDMERRHGCT